MTVAHPARYLVTGRAGNGKSSYINSAFGEYIARTDPFETCTMLVEHHALNTAYGDIILIDTPGFADGMPEDDIQRAKLIATHVRLAEINAVLYVTKLTDTRLRAEEKRTIRALTREFGPAFWHKAWLIFTFAAEVETTRRDEQVKMRKELICSTISEEVKAVDVSMPFYDFQQCWLIDNRVDDWADDLVPVAETLVRRK